VKNNCSPESVARSIREYEGVTRKHAIGRMIESLNIDSPDVAASFGEDAAVIRHGDSALLLAADGIWSKLMEADPFWSGYCAVLVNVHDIAAMGGRPVAMVDVLSVSDNEICEEVTRGLVTASRQFNVPIVGGHIHPESTYNVIDVAILGVAEMKELIYSHTAMPGDQIIAAIDLKGRVHPSCSMNWDSVTMKDPETVRSQIGMMQELGRKGIATAGKDISNPGVIGTLGMLLEVSRAGATIELDDIPRPDLKENGIPFDHWVKMYPGMGFVVTAREENTDEICRMFEGVGMTASCIGMVEEGSSLRVKHNGTVSTVFDLNKDGIMRFPASCNIK
jgi:putative methanogenesis marker protein 2